MPSKKMQLEIDKTLKRVNDGLRDFEGQWEKMESVPVRPRGAPSPAATGPRRWSGG